MQRFVDNILGVAQESIKTFCQESFNNTMKLINGLSALLLAILPGKTTILEGIQGWELQPTLRAPWLPRWMEEGVSSFNQIIHEYAADSDPEIESEHESGFEDNDSAIPSSPSSQTSHLCRASRLRLDRQSLQSSLFKQFVSGAFWHLRHLFGIGQSNHHLSTGSGRRHTTVTSSHRHSDSSGSLTRMYDLASKGFTSMKEYMVHHTTDRRRGVIEDLQLIVELFIEGVFDMLRNVLFYIFSPFEVVNLILGTLIFQEQKTLDEFTVQTATLGNSDPIPSLQQSRFRQAMNTDARTCEDIITELGYPYEALHVLTADGYILLMERIPRPESQKVLYLQHGLLDSSLGWVSNGVVGSQAFSAYDQGYDVFLGNLRGLASREHLDKNISSQRYWRYSVNEHGTMDIPAMLNKIHEIKVAELEHLQIAKEGRVGCTTINQQPYTLCGIAHSLGGAAMLIYVVTRRLEGKPHRLSRLILLSPAGFHEDAPIVCGFIQYVFPALAPLLTPIIPGLYIPTKFFRMLFNKLARDFQNYPALGGLVQTLCGYIVGGDSSNWIEAIGQTHYNIYDMPGVAYRVIIHLAQMRRANRFMLYDFGSISANMEAYGTSYPLDIGANYGVIDIPVDLVAGRKDKLIPKSNVKRHYQLLKERGCQVSYEENEYAHLDYTFKHREELLEYIMSRLRLVTPPESADSFYKPRKHSFGHGRSQGRREVKRLKSSKSGKALKPKDKDIVDELTIIGTPDIQRLASPTTSPSLKELTEGSFGQHISTNNRTMVDGAIQSNTDVFLDDSSIFSLSAKDVALAFSNSSSISNLSKLFKPGA